MTAIMMGSIRECRYCFSQFQRENGNETLFFG